ncbi:MAG: integrase core domain-containing protein [Acutalibacteraceae bacterium]
MAAGRNPDRPRDAIFRSDRCCQYTAKKTKELVESLGFRKSMSRPGTPSDNQPIESFWHTLEVEMPDIRHLNFEEASRIIINYIELYYNSERLHSGINYSVPNQFFTFLSVRNS